MYKKFLAAALAVTMVLGLAGCGGSGGSTQAASSQEKESSAAPAGSTGESTTAQAEGADAPAVIKVGFLTPLSGNNATYGAQCKAAGQMIACLLYTSITLHRGSYAACWRERGLGSARHMPTALLRYP